MSAVFAEPCLMKEQRGRETSRACDALHKDVASGSSPYSAALLRLTLGKANTSARVLESEATSNKERRASTLGEPVRVEDIAYESLSAEPNATKLTIAL